MYRKTSPILRDANRLLLEMEQSVRYFPRYHKYSLGSELRAQVFKINQLIARAWQYKDQSLYYLKRVIRAVDDLKIQLQLAKELKVFRNFAEFQRLAELTISLGKQSGGWYRKLSKRQPEAKR